MTNDRDHLTEVQDLCTGPLSEDSAALVLGEVYGLRQWLVFSSERVPDSYLPEDVHLYGHYRQPWNPAEVQVATCKASDKLSNNDIFVGPLADEEEISALIRSTMHTWIEDELRYSPQIDFRTARAQLAFSSGHGSFQWRNADWMLDNPFSNTKAFQIPMSFLKAEERQIRLRVTGKSTEHEVGHPQCTCGIYAYHDKNSLADSAVASAEDLPPGGAVYGLVKAYGFVTVGTKGLRAEKAQIVALTLPQLSRLDETTIDDAAQLWRDAGITVLPDLPSLLEFSERGGYLARPEDLRT